ncbi:MAG TPA: TIR-like protein FxsC [Actinocrinis sp.]|jgi:FxsC-like protein
MTRSAGADAATDFFFLSYAHTAPLDGLEPDPVDYWVEKLFRDLSAGICRETGLAPDTPVGFFDGTLQAGADWKAETTARLSTAEVFVPLYSSRYFAMSWPGREWACFATRLAGEPPGRPSPHIVPVLWSPLPSALDLPEADDPVALIGDAGEFEEYAANGLRALNMLRLYRELYEKIVGQLAKRIVHVAREHRLGRRAVPPLDRMPSEFRRKGADDDFVFAVAAPTAQTVPAGRVPGWYGAESTDWRPFGDRQELSLADHAIAVTERLGFSTEALPAGSAAAHGATAPTVVLIDPWIAAPLDRPEGAALRELRKLFEGGRAPWTMPLLVVNTADRESAECHSLLSERIASILSEVGALESRTAQLGAEGVRSLGDFARLMPMLVAEAERWYLRSPHFGRAAGPGAAREQAASEQTATETATEQSGRDDGTTRPGTGAGA